MARYVRVQEGLPLWMVLLATIAIIGFVGRIALIATLVILPFYIYYRFRAKVLAGESLSDIIGSIIGILLWIGIVWIIKR